MRTAKDYTKRRWHQEDLPLELGDEAEERELRSLEAQERAAVYFVRRPRETDRMATQQGHFSVSSQVLADHAALLHAATVDTHPDNPQFFRFIVKPEQKLGFLRRLLAMNVTARALFPGVDGLGKTVEELVRVTSHFTRETS